MRPPQRLPLLALAVLLAVGTGVAWRLARRVEAPASAPMSPTYVGSEACAPCHSAEHRAWQGSHHARAMQRADATTVLGDFSDAGLEHHGLRTSFSRRGERFVVTTDGADGGLADFEVKFTFGVYPLQQYLVELERGRLHALPQAWDARAARDGGQRWFHLHAGEDVRAGDVLHWTGRALRWNSACADCHSTAVRKGYDAATDSYRTTWSELSVGCEACHGPASAHVAAADAGQPVAPPARLDERRGVAWLPDAASGTAKRSAPRTSTLELEVCAPCHARRGQLHEGHVPGQPFADDYRPAVPAPGLTFADGQQRDEAFEWGSFLQSRMHHAGVTCGDCHEPHGGGLRAEGDALCAGCHLRERFEAAAHHHHAAASEGARCVSCHMPARTFMGVHARRDHSLRLPRPDLSVRLGTPNPCTGCHAQREARWAAEQLALWGVKPGGGFQQFAPAFAAAEADAVEAGALLVEVARGPHPPIARAGALELLATRPSAAAVAVAQAGLADPDALVRRASVTVLAPLPAPQRRALLVPALFDPLRSVRLEAATALADAMNGAPPEEQRAFEGAAQELEAAQALAADTPEGLTTLGVFHARRRRHADAERALRQALRLAPDFVPASLHLAEELRATQRDADGLLVLRAALGRVPDSAELQHALGLGLVRAGQPGAALEALAAAAALAPRSARYAWVHAVALATAGRLEPALAEVRRGLGVRPGDVELLVAGATYAGQLGAARERQAFLDELRRRYPDDAAVRRFVKGE